MSSIVCILCHQYYFNAILLKLDEKKNQHIWPQEKKKWITCGGHNQNKFFIIFI